MRNGHPTDVSLLILGLALASPGCGSSSNGFAPNSTGGTSADASVGVQDSGEVGEEAMPGSQPDSSVQTDGSANSTVDSGPLSSFDSSLAAGDASSPSDSSTTTTGTLASEEGPPSPDDGGVAVDPSLLAKCSGTAPIACHFGGSIGNYDITVEVGGATAGNTSVMAEISREMLAPVATTAGETAKYTMVVNVREPEGQPVADLTGAASLPSGLDMYFWGNDGGAALLSGIGYAPAVDPIVVYLATDSTGCDQFDTAFAGWGQWLPQYFSAPISVANYGNSGVDTPGFATLSHYWPTIQGLITAKDFLLIELGDNDKTDSEAAITQGLTTMITGARAKGATPLLMTPANRAIFTNGVVDPYMTGNVPTVMAQVAAAQNVTLLDLTTRTTTWIQSLGPNGYAPYFAPGENDHFNQAGANIVSGFVRDLIVEAKVPVLSSYVR
ncbi:MAG: GDSL-type esterase/lipase family protein [Polyangiaceae bacterium]